LNKFHNNALWRLIEKANFCKFLQIVFLIIWIFGANAIKDISEKTPFFNHKGCVNDEKNEASRLSIEVCVQHAVPVIVESVKAITDAFAR